ncbi:unnamed protein product [Paramecium sonneborni]|uniref:Uncharacterized protein n=1 Tax=Paramecium sonneborni TaxID=65129 RepID=A0A8S1NDZ9_9CILI|nr:unnamed protein product [Paramecium sonneborni]
MQNGFVQQLIIQIPQLCQQVVTNLLKYLNTNKNNQNKLSFQINIQMKFLCIFQKVKHTLNFMQKSNQYIFGSYELKIWSFNKKLMDLQIEIKQTYKLYSLFIIEQ